MPDEKISLEAATRRYKQPISSFAAFRCAVVYNILHYFIVIANKILSVKERFVTSAHPPTLVKKYACLPKLPIRIFYPKDFNSNSQKKLPTILSIHGGGFVIGDPRDDDLFNYNFANMHSVLVIALNYRKAPRARFPTPIYDLEQLVFAVLSDSSLHIDKDRVALMGFSAGGNLALSVSILPSMCGSGDGIRRIKTVIPIYPVVDVSVTHQWKTQTRQYKPSIGGFRANSVDLLSNLSPVFDAAYTLVGQDFQDPLLSPIYASKEQLPQNIFMIADELDMLANESWRMICGLSGRPIEEQTVGRRRVGPSGKLILDDEKFSFGVKNHDINYRWLLIPDQIHGYDHYDSMELLHGDKELSKDAELKTKEAQKLIGEWLFEGPFA
ncbi:hypothetical protein FGSG_03785 [Fusarium graminearum PH-1]|nr:hypothetical protein FGSG_03785 [Fusarium graminearum PH-1]ESU09403.1 hypothetical protein FGSG_03785 [Fusarium graminearum PH-1]SCB65855.1 unnamed protein product [Fusarium graminearum]|eukprot:XP_011321902.1 hypothetical protein FGSG_03785 [Fusarium graminearum PH-1]